MANLTAISSVLLAVVGIAALFIAIAPIREFRHEARLQHLVELARRFDRPSISDARRALARERMNQKQQVLKSLDVDDPPDQIADVLDFLDHVGP